MIVIIVGRSKNKTTILSADFHVPVHSARWELKLISFGALLETPHEANNAILAEAFTARARRQNSSASSSRLSPNDAPFVRIKFLKEPGLVAANRIVDQSAVLAQDAFECVANFACSPIFPY
jgi:hypothetical protein